MFLSDVQIFSYRNLNIHGRLKIKAPSKVIKNILWNLDRNICEPRTGNIYVFYNVGIDSISSGKICGPARYNVGNIYNWC